MLVLRGPNATGLATDVSRRQVEADDQERRKLVRFDLMGVQVEHELN